MTDVVRKVILYKNYLESTDDATKIIVVLKKLAELSVSTEILQSTGVGKTVNGLRKQGGAIAEQSRKLVATWKTVVTKFVHDEKLKAEALAKEEADRAIRAKEAEQRPVKILDLTAASGIPVTATPEKKKEDDFINDEDSDSDVGSGNESEEVIDDNENDEKNDYSSDNQRKNDKKSASRTKERKKEERSLNDFVAELNSSRGKKKTVRKLASDSEDEEINQKDDGRVDGGKCDKKSVHEMSDESDSDDSAEEEREQKAQTVSPFILKDELNKKKQAAAGMDKSRFYHQLGGIVTRVVKKQPEDPKVVKKRQKIAAYIHKDDDLFSDCVLLSQKKDGNSATKRSDKMLKLLNKYNLKPSVTSVKKAGSNASDGGDRRETNLKSDKDDKTEADTRNSLNIDDEVKVDVPIGFLNIKSENSLNKLDSHADDMHTEQYHEKSRSSSPESVGRSVENSPILDQNSMHSSPKKNEGCDSPFPSDFGSRPVTPGIPSAHESPVLGIESRSWDELPVVDSKMKVDENYSKKESKEVSDDADKHEKPYSGSKSERNQRTELSDNSDDSSCRENSVKLTESIRSRKLSVSHESTADEDEKSDSDDSKKKKHSKQSRPESSDSYRDAKKKVSEATKGSTSHKKSKKSKKSKDKKKHKKIRKHSDDSSDDDEEEVNSRKQLRSRTRSQSVESSMSADRSRPKKKLKRSKERMKRRASDDSVSSSTRCQKKEKYKKESSKTKHLERTSRERYTKDTFMKHKSRSRSHSRNSSRKKSRSHSRSSNKLEGKERSGHKFRSRSRNRSESRSHDQYRSGSRGRKARSKERLQESRDHKKGYRSPSKNTSSNRQRRSSASDQSVNDCDQSEQQRKVRRMSDSESEGIQRTKEYSEVKHTSNDDRYRSKRKDDKFGSSRRHDESRDKFACDDSYRTVCVKSSKPALRSRSHSPESDGSKHKNARTADKIKDDVKLKSSVDKNSKFMRDKDLLGGVQTLSPESHISTPDYTDLNCREIKQEKDCGKVKTDIKDESARKSDAKVDSMPHAKSRNNGADKNRVRQHHVSRKQESEMEVDRPKEIEKNRRSENTATMGKEMFSNRYEVGDFLQEWEGTGERRIESRDHMRHFKIDNYDETFSNKLNGDKCGLATRADIHQHLLDRDRVEAHVKIPDTKTERSGYSMDKKQNSEKCTSVVENTDANFLSFDEHIVLPHKSKHKNKHNEKTRVHSSSNDRKPLSLDERIDHVLNSDSKTKYSKDKHLSKSTSERKNTSSDESASRRHEKTTRHDFKFPSPPQAEITITEQDIETYLPTPSSNYRPWRFNSSTTAEKPPQPVDIVDEVLVGKKSNTRTMVYSGKRSTANSEIASLYDSCMRCLIDNIDSLEYVGGVPYYIMKPVLERCTAEQLCRLEECNPYFIQETDELWKIHCAKDFKNSSRQPDECWREVYLRRFDERECKLQSLKQNIAASQEARQAPVRTTKMAFMDGVAKPPRQVLKQQMRHGTATVARASPSSSGANVAGYRRHKPSPFDATPGERSSRPVKTTGPMMKKTIQMMKAVRR